MTKAEELGLKFYFIEHDGMRPIPLIDTQDISGAGDNQDLAMFLQECHISTIIGILEEIEELDPSETIDGIMIQDSYEQYALIYSPPFEIRFNTGGDDFILPVEDFVLLLEEWRDFLSQLPFDHPLKN